MSDIKELIKSKLRPIGDAIREKNGSTELIPIDDMPQAIRDIQGGGGGIVEVTELPEVGKANTVYKLIHKNVGTEVPTTGLIENVYLNTSLSIDEVNAILKTIEYIPATNEGEPDIYIVFETLDSIVRIFDYNNGSYAIMVGMNVAYVSDESFVSAGVTFVGWNPDLTNPCVVYQESTPTDDFVSQNDKLTDLFSVTPFEEEKIPSEMYYLYHKSTTVAVPNSGIVENVYFNTELSVEEVNSYLDSITYTFTNEHFILKNEDDSRSIIIKRIASVEPTGYYIECITNNTDNGLEYVYISSKELAQLYGMDFVGWNPNFNGVYKVDSNVVSTTRTAGKIVDVGSENDKLTSLFSLTQFSYYEQISGGILEVDKLPTSGENDYVYALIKQLTYALYINEQGTISNLTELAQQQGGKVEVVAVVDSLPTEDIIVSPSDMEMNLYYIKNDGLYVYADSTGDGNVTWHNFADAMGLPFSGEVTSESDMTVTDSLYLLPSGGDSADYYIYEKGEPTQVPNSGYVERVYFNTSLSEDEYYNILKNITFTDGAVIGLSGISFYASMAYMNNSNTYVLGFIKYAEDNIHFGLINFSSMLTIQNFFLGGWEVFDNPYSINSEVLSTLRGLPNGTENDKLINVISTTPYPRWTKISGGGATVKATPEVVPNTGYVERVYLNKSLTFDEVNAICTKANSFVANEIVPIYCVVSNDTFDKQLSTFKLTDHDGTTFNSIHYPNLGNVIWSERDYYNEEKDGSITQFKKGWMFEEDYVEINSEVVSFIEGDFAVNVGQHNDQLTELFSINNVFETNEIELTESYDGSSLVLSNKYVKKTVVPNEGYVERVYFNTALSVDEVKLILNNYLAKHPSNENNGYDGRVILTNVDNIDNPSDPPEKLILLGISQNSDTKALALLNGFAEVLWTETTEGWTVNYTGWKPDLSYVEVNHKVYTSFEGFSNNVGAYNDELVDLFSLTPFEEKIYDSVEVDIKEMLKENKLPLEIKVNVESESVNVVKGGGTVVPNSGYVEKVYFNTKLNVEEVETILDTLTYFDGTSVGLTKESYVILSNEDMSKSICIAKYYFTNTGERYYEIYGYGLGLNLTIIQSSVGGFNKDFVSLGGVISIYFNLLQMQPIGVDNDKLINLISSTPTFGDDKVIKELSGDYEAVDLEVTENTTVDVGAMLDEGKIPMSVKVNVERQEPNLQEKEITENGEYVADEGYDGFSKVTVNVESSGSSVSPMKLLLDGKKQANFLFQDFSGESIDDIISYSDTENVTDTTYMFNGCSALTAIPQLDTSKVTNAQYMFNGCSALTAIPQLDTSNVTNMNSMFNGCSALTAIPQLDTSKVTNMKQMFNYCKALTEIPQLDMIKVSNANSMFNSCSKLTNLTLLNIKAQLDLSQNEKLTLESLINTVKEFINVGSARILTMGTANLSKIASTYVKFTDSSVTSIPKNEKGDVVVCESTDTGAMLLKDYALLKNWTLA